MTILLFFNDTRKLIIPENSANIFNRDIVNVLLEPYSITEGINFTYDDIRTIIIIILVFHKLHVVIYYPI